MLQQLFIVGRGRSGTTLLARLLTQHHAVTVAPEGLFVLELQRKYGRARFLDARIDTFCTDLLADPRMRSWHLDSARLRARLSTRAAQPGGLDYAGACQEVYASYARDTLGCRLPRVLGDKNPSHALFVPRLLRLFPQARFIHVTRDYRENVRSYSQVGFDLSEPAALAYRWRRFNAEILRAAALAHERFLHLRYEDLLCAPRAQLGRVCRFLGLAFDPAMLVPAADGRRVGPSGGRGWFQRPVEGIDPARARSRASRVLSPRALRDADAICAPIAAKVGYPAPPRSRLSWPGLAGMALGWASVQAERALFEALPGRLRAPLLAAYRGTPARRAPGEG